MYFKHVPASKRRVFGEGRKNGDMKAKATDAVLATFRYSEDPKRPGNNSIKAEHPQTT